KPTTDRHSSGYSIHKHPYPLIQHKYAAESAQTNTKHNHLISILWQGINMTDIAPMIKILSVENIVTLDTAPHPIGKTLKIGKSKKQGLNLIIEEKILSKALNHGRQTTDEIGGAIIGQPYLSEDGQVSLHIIDLIEADAPDAGPAHVRFTAETWRKLHQQAREQFPDYRVVGWYHSHPSMGIFLSAMDMDIHQYFFQNPWQVALVVNGQDNIFGFFGWDNDVIKPIMNFSAIIPEDSYEAKIDKRRY